MPLEFMWHVSMLAVRSWQSARQTRVSRLADQMVPSSNVAFSHIETPSRWKQGDRGESEADDEFAVHVDTARCAAVSRCSSVVELPCRAAAVVQVLGATALSRGTERARGANVRVFRTVLSNLARLATEGVRGVVARSTDRALAAAQEGLVRAGRAFKTPSPVGAAWSIGSL